MFANLLNLYCVFQGLKTGMYYLRTKPAATPNQVTVDKTKLNRSVKIGTESNGVVTEGKEAEQGSFNLNAMVCSLQNKDECLMCGS
jgi:ribonucleoside-diphosphate reductase subunit M1